MIKYDVKLKCPCGKTHVVECSARNHTEAGENARFFAERFDKLGGDECDWMPEFLGHKNHVYSAVVIAGRGILESPLEPRMS